MKKKTWLYFLVVGVIMAGGTVVGINPAATGTVADTVATQVSESTSIDD